MAFERKQGVRRRSLLDRYHEQPNARRIRRWDRQSGSINHSSGNEQTPDLWTFPTAVLANTALKGRLLDFLLRSLAFSVPGAFKILHELLSVGLV
jgi:hypothetical protein